MSWSVHCCSKDPASKLNNARVWSKHSKRVRNYETCRVCIKWWKWLYLIFAAWETNSFLNCRHRCDRLRVNRVPFPGDTLPSITVLVKVVGLCNTHLAGCTSVKKEYSYKMASIHYQIWCMTALKHWSLMTEVTKSCCTCWTQMTKIRLHA